MRSLEERLRAVVDLPAAPVLRSELPPPLPGDVDWRPPEAPKRPPVDRDDDRIRELWLTGASTRAIATRLGRPAPTVWRRLAAQGLHRTKSEACGATPRCARAREVRDLRRVRAELRRHTARQRALEALRLRGQGTTFAAIGTMLGLTTEGARRAVLRAEGWANG